MRLRSSPPHVCFLTLVFAIAAAHVLVAARTGSTPLLQTLHDLELARNYFGNARVYRYPDAPGQSKEELIECYRAAHLRCGDSRDEPCDPDDDASPGDGTCRSALFCTSLLKCALNICVACPSRTIGIPSSRLRLSSRRFGRTVPAYGGKRGQCRRQRHRFFCREPVRACRVCLLVSFSWLRRRIPDVPLHFDCDAYVHRLLMMSDAAGYCNGMSHHARLVYWRQLLHNSSATGYGNNITRRHVFISVAWLGKRLLVRHGRSAGKDLARMAGSMTFVINERNDDWTGVSFGGCFARRLHRTLRSLRVPCGG